jgi:hypothetical protein
MNRKFLLLAGAFGALFAGSATSTPPNGPGVNDLDLAAGPRIVIGADQIVGRTPAPEQPVAQPIAGNEVAVRAREVGPQNFRRFIERPGRRKVKYGKNRWVILG